MRWTALILLAALLVADIAPTSRADSARARHRHRHRKWQAHDRDPCDIGTSAPPLSCCGSVPHIQDRRQPRSGGTSRITYSRDQDYGEFPSFVSIMDRLGNVVCGGTLISKRLVLTAAHCSFATKVLLGPYRPHDNDGKETISIATRGVCRAPGYKDWDLASPSWTLFRLATDAHLESHVQPACVPARGHDRSQAPECWLVGAGTHEVVEASDHPDGEGLIHIVSHLVKKLRVQERPCPLPLPGRRQACYGPAGGGGRASSCTGDLGGPVLCRENNRSTVVALLSASLHTDNTCDYFAPPQARPVKPSLYMDVAAIWPDIRATCSWMFVGAGTTASTAVE